MNRENQVKFYGYLSATIGLTGFVLLIVNVFFPNVVETPNRWTIAISCIVLFYFMRFTGKFLFPHRKNIEMYKQMAKSKMTEYGESNLRLGLDYCDRIINIDPNDYEAYIMKAHFYDELGQRDNAIKWLSKSIELHPKHRNSSVYGRYKVRGTWYLEIGNYKAAKEDLLKSLGQKEPEKNTMYYLGVTEEKLGDVASALESYKKYFDLAGNNGYRGIEAKATIRIANLYFQRGDVENARKYFSKFCSEYGNFSPERNVAEEEMIFDLLNEKLKTG